MAKKKPSAVDAYKEMSLKELLFAMDERVDSMTGKAQAIRTKTEEFFEEVSDYRTMRTCLVCALLKAGVSKEIIQELI